MTGAEGGGPAPVPGGRRGSSGSGGPRVLAAGDHFVRPDLLTAALRAELDGGDKDGGARAALGDRAFGVIIGGHTVFLLFTRSERSSRPRVTRRPWSRRSLASRWRSPRWRRSPNGSSTPPPASG